MTQPSRILWLAVFAAAVLMLPSKAAAQSVSAQPARFGSGTTVTVTGSGFSPNSIVNVWYDASLTGTLVSQDTSASPTTDGNGAFSTSLVVKGSPGDYFIHAGPSTIAVASASVEIGSCWFQECIINGVDTVCVLKNSPTDLLSYFADCHTVEADYTTSPTGYDLNNNGAAFGGAGLLAAATADLATVTGIPGPIPMTAAILAAEAGGSSVPDKLSLLAIASTPAVGICPVCVGPLDEYILGVNVSGHDVPDGGAFQTAVAGIEAVLPQPVLVAAQAALAQAAVAGAIACGYVNYYCNGSDITKTMLENPGTQTQGIPLIFLQPPIWNAPSPNLCPAAGVNCWGGLIGWAQVACTALTPDFEIGPDGKEHGVCERADPQGNLSQLPVPGSAGSPDNSGAPVKCVTGTVGDLSIGYDGDVSFDVSGDNAKQLMNYHNLLPGPGGTNPPNGIDVESPLSDRPTFHDIFARLRPNMDVNVCGRWVADMHQLWNELHPMTSLSIVPRITYTGATSSDFNDAAQVQAQLTDAGSPVANESLTFTLGPGPTPSCSATTDPSGFATCPLTPTQAAGTYTLTIAFAGDSKYGANSIATPFTVTLEETAIAFTAASAPTSDFDDAATVQAQLTTDGNALPNAQVKFVLGSGAGTETCLAKTDGSGLASCSITPAQQAGAYSLTASFTSDGFYAATSASASFTVTKEQTSMSFTPGSPTVIANNHATAFSATLKEDGVTPIVGRTITITIGSQSCSAGPTDATGTASCSITLSQALGPGTITASFAGDGFYLPSSTSEAVTVFSFLARGAMAIGNLNAAVGSSVNFWGSQWSNLNSLSGGPAPSGMKGYADGFSQSCGAPWTGDTGTSGNPPATVPSYMGVVVSSTITMQGSTALVGDAPMIVVVRTNPGYGPAAGQAGTGTVVAVLCHQ